LFVTFRLDWVTPVKRGCSALARIGDRLNWRFRPCMNFALYSGYKADDDILAL